MSVEAAVLTRPSVPRTRFATAANDFLEHISSASMEYMSKSDMVSAALREMIISGELEPGASLRQREFADRFEVSLTPVREALRRLESEGLVIYDPHRGARVVDAMASAAEENYEVRAVLEAFAAGLAATRISADEIAELREINAELGRCDARDEIAQELNRRFHFRIYEACRSPLLLALLRLLWHSFPDPIRMTRPLEISVEQHTGIIDALERGDRPETERLAAEHIRSSLESKTSDSTAVEAKREATASQDESRG